MSVAKCLGVDDLDAPNMRELRAEWPNWRQMSSDLPDVDDLKDLPRWMQDAEPTQRDEVLTALRRIAESDRRAHVALAWLLMPGASRIAGRIRRLADEIDEVVAGQLWVQICEHDPVDDRYVAKKILDRVYSRFRCAWSQCGVFERLGEQEWTGSPGGATGPSANLLRYPRGIWPISSQRERPPIPRFRRSGAVSGLQPGSDLVVELEVRRPYCRVSEN